MGKFKLPPQRQHQQKTDAPTQKSEPTTQDSFDLPAPIQIPTSLNEVTPNNIISMQRHYGNRATQQILQRNSIIQRENDPPATTNENENENNEDIYDDLDEDVEGTIVFDESEADTITVTNPWTTAPLQSDPDLMTKHQGVKTLVKAGKDFAKKTDPLRYKYHFDNDTIVETGGEGELNISLLKKKAKIKDVSNGMPDKWKKPFIKVNQDYEFTTGVTATTLPKSKKIKLYKFSDGTKDYLTKQKNITSRKKQYVVLKIGTDEYHANPEDLYEGEAGHKKTDDPLFPDGDVLPEHVKQTGLGDCYLQAFLVNTAVQNPTHLKNMMFDNGDGSVTVRFYYKNGANWDAEFVKIEKSIATGVSGNRLYNDGALWAHMIEKSFTVFAGKHGMYGDALSPPTDKGYGAIEGGWTYQLGGVFYGQASKEATLENMGLSTDMNRLAKANYTQIKKLYELKANNANDYLSNDKETVMLTASASWYDTLKRLIRTATALEATLDTTEDLGKAVKNMREITQEAKKATDDPTNSGKDKMDIQEVVDAVKKAAEYVVGDGIIGKQALANPDDRQLNLYYDLLNNFKELGSDSSPNQRFIYNHHAYSVVDFEPKDTEGNNYWPSKDDLDTKKNDVLQKLDSSQTLVILRNPHRTNTPTQNATEIEAGKFSMTLDQFLTSFTRIEYGRVEKS